MSDEKYTGPIAGLFQKMADLIGKDVYFVNFILFHRKDLLLKILKEFFVKEQYTVGCKYSLWQ